MKNKDKAKAQPTDELAEMPEQIAGLEESETERKQAGEAVQRNRAWLPTAGMFVLLCILVCLNEILDFPHLLLGAPHTPINWQEAIIEMALIASVGLFTVLRLIRDMTERKRAEEMLRESEEREREAIAAAAAAQMAIDTIEAMGDGLIIHTMDGRLTFVNPAFEKMAGYQQSELVGKDAADVAQKVVKPKDLEKTMGAIEAALGGKASVSTPITLVSKEGRETPVTFIVSLIQDAAGDPTTVVVVFTDITKLKRAEETLRESEQWLSATLRSIGDAVIATDAKGLVTLVNPVAGDLTGWDEAEAVGQPLEDVFNIINEQTGQQAENPVTRVLREGIVVGLANHTVLIAKDGTKRSIADSGAPMTDEEGNVIGTVMVFRDVTEPRRAEEAVRQYAQRLAVLWEIGCAISSSLDLENTLQVLLDELTELPHVDATSIMVLKPGTKELETVAIRHLSEEFARMAEVILQEGLPHLVAEREKPLVITDLMEDERVVYRDLLQREGLVFYIGLPLLARSELIGVLGIYSRERHRWSQEQTDFFHTLARQAAIALENAQLYQEAQQRAEALQESEEQTKQLQEYLQLQIERMPMGLIVWDTEFRVRSWNPAAEKIFGFTAQEALGEHPYGLIVPKEAQPHVDDIWRRLLQGDTTAHSTNENITKDGHIIICQWSNTPLKEAGGTVVGVLSMLQDITERKQAEEALQRYTERLRILRAIDGVILAAWSPEEIAQVALRHMRRLVPCLGAGVVMFDFEAQEATVFALHANGEAGLETGTRFPLKGVLDINALRQGKVHVVGDILASSQPVWLTQALQAAGVRSYITAPLIAHGELMGVLGLGSESPGAFTPEHVDIAHEVADQLAVGLRQAHLRAALEAGEQRLAVLVEHLPGGILLLDGEHRILLSNPAAQTYLPLLADAAVGDVLTLMADRPVEEVLVPPSEGLWHELQVSGPPRRVFEVVARPVAAAPKAEGWMLVIRDVTQEREVQRRVQRQERLAAVGQLAGGIAHDFNNLLTTIMLYAQLPLGKHDLTPDLRRALETIIGESRQAAKLVQQILDFSRRSPIEIRPVDLKPFIKEAVRVLERTIPESIRLRLEAGPEEHVVNADPTRIQQALMNLVVNARDAMPEGGELRIDLSRVEVGPGEGPPVAEMVPGEWVCLAVSDTGTGIPPEALPHLFEPFFTTKEPGKGTGLGLAQVDGIVAQHEGHIGVETELGRGTTFRVYLPAIEAEAEVMEEAVSALPQGQGETILLVEDNEKLREGGQELLESLGYRVLTAANGREALEVYRVARSGDRPQQGVDLVITDVVMPEMGGKRLMRELRKTHPGLKALAITGYIVEENVHELRKEGFLDVVYKPFDMDTLAQVVRQVLDED